MPLIGAILMRKSVLWVVGNPMPLKSIWGRKFFRRTNNFCTWGFSRQAFIYSLYGHYIQHVSSDRGCYNAVTTRFEFVRHYFQSLDACWVGQTLGCDSACIITSFLILILFLLRSRSFYLYWLCYFICISVAPREQRLRPSVVVTLRLFALVSHWAATR